MSSKVPTSFNTQEQVILTKFNVDNEMMDLFQEVTDNCGVGESTAEWPNNLISNLFAIYEDGLISKRSTPRKPEHRVSAKELQLCRTISQHLEARCTPDLCMGGTNRDFDFGAFYMTAQLPEVSIADIDGTADIPTEITPALIRSKFANTIFPLATIEVEPLRDTGKWWEAVCLGLEDEEDPVECLLPWYDVIEMFQSHPDLHSPVFVQIGDEGALSDIDKKDYPLGTEITGCVMPRMPLALTAQGSIVGLYADIVLA